MWKANNVQDCPLSIRKLEVNPDARLTRAVTREDLKVEGRSLVLTSTFINDATRA